MGKQLRTINENFVMNLKVKGNPFWPREREREREKWDYWKDQRDYLDGVTIPTPYLQQFFYVIQSHVERIMIWILF